MTFKSFGAITSQKANAIIIFGRHMKIQKRWSEEENQLVVVWVSWSTTSFGLDNKLLPEDELPGSFISFEWPSCHSGWISYSITSCNVFGA